MRHLELHVARGVPDEPRKQQEARGRCRVEGGARAVDLPGVPDRRTRLITLQHRRVTPH